MLSYLVSQPSLLPVWLSKGTTIAISLTILYVLAVVFLPDVQRFWDRVAKDLR